MLKIKDDVDLKELENLGFNNDEEDGKLFYLIGNTQRFEINQWNRKIIIKQQIITEFGETRKLDERILIKLFDLIQAGLVEKVGDE